MASITLKGKPSLRLDDTARSAAPYHRATPGTWPGKSTRPATPSSPARAMQSSRRAPWPGRASFTSWGRRAMARMSTCWLFRPENSAAYTSRASSGPTPSSRRSASRSPPLTGGRRSGSRPMPGTSTILRPSLCTVAYWVSQRFMVMSRSVTGAVTRSAAFRSSPLAAGFSSPNR